MPLPTAPLPPTTLTPLLHDSHLLSLLHHRNHNQHRLTKWYRHLTTLHRHLRHLLHDSTLITSASTTPERNTAITRADQRISYLRDVVVPRAWDAFRTVVRDKQFVAVGVVLWGVLGRVWRLLGGHEMVAMEKEAQMEELKDVIMKDVEGVEEGMEDVMEGEVLSREAYEKAMEEQEMLEGRIEVKIMGRQKEAEEAGKEKKKKKRRRMDTDVESEARDEKETSSASGKEKKKKKKRDIEEAIERQQQERESLSDVPKKRKKRPVDDDATDQGGTVKAEIKKKKSKKRKKEDDIDALFSGIF